MIGHMGVVLGIYRSSTLLIAMPARTRIMAPRHRVRGAGGAAVALVLLSVLVEGAASVSAEGQDQGGVQLTVWGNTAMAGAGTSNAGAPLASHWASHQGVLSASLTLRRSGQLQ